MKKIPNYLECRMFMFFILRKSIYFISKIKIGFGLNLKVKNRTTTAVYHVNGFMYCQKKYLIHIMVYLNTQPCKHILFIFLKSLKKNIIAIK
jgi:hypothetical protein